MPDMSIKLSDQYSDGAIYYFFTRHMLMDVGSSLCRTAGASMEEAHAQSRLVHYSNVGNAADDL